jgi:hypothetical protein
MVQNIDQGNWRRRQRIESFNFHSDDNGVALAMAEPPTADDKRDEIFSSRNSQGMMAGDFGMALFNPLAGLACSSPHPTRIVWDMDEKEQGTWYHSFARPEDSPFQGRSKEQSLDSCANFTIDSLESTAAATPGSLECLAVDLKAELPHVLEECPRILTMEMMHQLHEEGLSGSQQMCRWERCFAIGRDGDSFCTFVERSSAYQRTFVVIQTVEGFVLGGYAAVPWKKNDQASNSYYGTGQSFLFSSHPAGVAASTNPARPLHLYRWTGTNDFCQISDPETSRLGMGGGTDFGFLIQDDFCRGRSGPCHTFGNPSLVPSSDCFEIQAMEVYGLRPFSQSLADTSSPSRQWAVSPVSCDGMEV